MCSHDQDDSPILVHESIITSATIRGTAFSSEGPDHGADDGCSDRCDESEAVDGSLLGASSSGPSGSVCTYAGYQILMNRFPN